MLSDAAMKEATIGKYTGTGVIDAQGIKDKLVDIMGGEIQGYQRQKPGFDLAAAELESVMATHGDAAGIHASVYGGFKEKTALLTQIRTLKPAVAKLLEVLCESEIYYEDSRERDITRMAKTVLDAAHHEGKASLLPLFEKTLSYRSQYADKAAATRRKNEDASEEEPNPATNPADQPNPAPAA
jgi:hypothetical protein